MEERADKRLRNPVLITGASGGIGYELSRLFARDGHDLILVSRNEARLEEVAEEFGKSFGVRSLVLAKDLAVPGSPNELFEELERSSVEVDVLVNNAGFGILGAFHKSQLDEQLDMIQLDVTSLAHLTRLFLPGMVERGRGRVVNVASIAAFQAGPFMAVYYASKAFVVSFSEAIANELKGTGVTVTAICPGPTVTDFQKRAGVEDSTLFDEKMTMDAATVARIGYDGIKKNKTLVITGVKNNVLAFGNRFVPRSLATRLARSLNEPRIK